MSKGEGNHLFLVEDGFEEALCYGSEGDRHDQVLVEMVIMDSQIKFRCGICRKCGMRFVSFFTTW